MPPVMKTVFRHPPENLHGKRYWRSLEELADAPQFRDWLHREFPAGASEVEVDGLSRRNFLRVMGASLGLAGIGLTGCRRPEAYVVPYTKSVEWLIPGKAVLYTTSMPGPQGGLPLIATTYEGRPTKLEGNPLVPWGNGGTDLFAQATVLDLYDPDRARAFTFNGLESTAQEFDKFLGDVRKELESSKGAGIGVFLDEQFSPTRDRILRSLQEQFPQIKFYSYEPLGFQDRDAAVSALFGPDVAIRPAFANADVIVSLDCDFLGSEQTLQGVRDFSRRRRVRESADQMNRLYAVENRYTPTGGLADHRFRCATSQIPGFALQLAKKLAQSTNDRVLTAVVSEFKDTGTQFDDAWLTECANDLVASKGRSLVLVGNRHPALVQGVVLAMNSALDGLGSTLAIFSVPRVKSEGLSDLVAQANWVIPEAHFLESWGDQRAPDGTYLPIQPMILPLFCGLSQVDILSRLAALPSGVQAIRDTFKSLTKES